MGRNEIKLILFQKFPIRILPLSSQRTFLVTILRHILVAMVFNILYGFVFFLRCLIWNTLYPRFWSQCFFSQWNDINFLKYISYIYCLLVIYFVRKADVYASKKYARTHVHIHTIASTRIFHTSYFKYFSQVSFHFYYIYNWNFINSTEINFVQYFWKYLSFCLKFIAGKTFKIN